MVEDDSVTVMAERKARWDKNLKRLLHNRFIVSLEALDTQYSVGCRLSKVRELWQGSWVVLEFMMGPHLLPGRTTSEVGTLPGCPLSTTFA